MQLGLLNVSKLSGRSLYFNLSCIKRSLIIIRGYLPVIFADNERVEILKDKLWNFSCSWRNRKTSQFDYLFLLQQ